ncbi:hypothetical protein EAE96_004058 [Botrytis aclada]|nr:hypothetical protein EAE96_004058 [Botrytis aclada]
MTCPILRTIHGPVTVQSLAVTGSQSLERPMSKIQGPLSPRSLQNSLPDRGEHHGRGRKNRIARVLPSALNPIRHH